MADRKQHVARAIRLPEFGVLARWSELGFKAYNQGRGAFERITQHVIWTDKGVPLDVYDECVIRTATTNGILMLTFTPLAGLTDTVLQFLPGMRPGD